MSYREETLQLFEEVSQKEREKWDRFLEAQGEAFWARCLQSMPEMKNKEQMKRQLLSPFSSKSEKVIINGFALLLEDASRILNPREVESMNKEIISIASQLKDGSLVPIISDDTPLAKAFNFTPQFLTQVQKMALYYFDRRQFQNASTLFKFLGALNPAVAESWLFLGHSERAQGHIREATSAYLAAAMAGVDDPTPYLLAARINCKENKDQARFYLDAAKTLVKEGEFTKEIAEIEKDL